MLEAVRRLGGDANSGTIVQIWFRRRPLALPSPSSLLLKSPQKLYCLVQCPFLEGKMAQWQLSERGKESDNISLQDGEQLDKGKRFENRYLKLTSETD